ncbi:RNA polymerase sigma factor, SigM family [Clostridioides difficile]|nr:RNA polymerase sigma factor, SigM family [Clostridioides difficile]
MQETFIKTYENIDILVGGNLKAWMFKVSINKFYTLYKKSRTNLFLTDELSYTLKSDFEISDIDNSIDINKVLSKMSESHKNYFLII